jgi:tetratricopeptide (TPR) repeat protein/cold shock CspA family protein
LAEAEIIARDALLRFPDDTYTIKQAAWTFAELDQHHQAAELFDRIWQAGPDDYIISSYIRCLRKVGRLDDAETIGRDGLNRKPQDQFIRRELGWVIYDKYLKPAKEDSDLDAITKIAYEIIGLHSDELLLTRTVLAVIKVAKDQNNVRWRVVLEWADKINPQMLDAQAKEYNGKRVMSDRETFYIGRTRALLETDRHQEAINQAQEGLQEFPRSFFLARYDALAHAAMSNIDYAVEKMRQLQRHPRCDWYATAELANLEHQLGNNDEAYRLMCSALNTTRQSAEYKIGYFVTLACIAMALGKTLVAAAHLKLARVIRARKEWSTPSELLQAEKVLHEISDQPEGSDFSMPDNENDLVRFCQKLWIEGSSNPQERIQGVILSPRTPGDGFTFIKPSHGGEKIFVHARNLPRNYHEGMTVDFAVKPSFDKKRNRESVEAVDVRPV